MSDYVMRWITDPAALDAVAWDALVRARCGRLHPALRHAYPAAMHTSGSASAGSGWEPEWLTLWRGATLVGAIVLYRKHHSYGEYVFDWAWADAYRRHGVEYYPKWLAAIPFTPVGAPKLLAVDAEVRELLVTALMQQTVDSGLSSLHVLFPAPDEREVLETSGLTWRRGVQFHWHNPGFRNFGDYLDSLAGPKRKKVRAERRKVREAGVTLRAMTGAEASAEDWAFFERCYAQTYREHHSTPYLNHRFFASIAAGMGDQVLLVIAEQSGARVAATLSLFDEQVLYGRYWGSIRAIDSLHFEACYYTPIEFCIERRIGLFEGGAQGEHKMARGFLPTETASAHWLADQAFADAVDNFIERESMGIGGYLDELSERSPMRGEPPA
ncbi:GNAT family N-acetyltransferase [soil metagenome]